MYKLSPGEQEDPRAWARQMYGNVTLRVQQESEALNEASKQANKPPFSDNPKLNQLLEEYKQRYAALSPEQKRVVDRENRINWVYATLTCTGRRPNITRELVEKLYDERHSS